MTAVPAIQETHFATHFNIPTITRVAVLPCRMIYSTEAGLSSHFERHSGSERARSAILSVHAAPRRASSHSERHCHFELPCGTEANPNSYFERHCGSERPRSVISSTQRLHPIRKPKTSRKTFDLPAHHGKTATKKRKSFACALHLAASLVKTPQKTDNRSHGLFTWLLPLGTPCKKTKIVCVCSLLGCFVVTRVLRRHTHFGMIQEQCSVSRTLRIVDLLRYLLQWRIITSLLIFFAICCIGF